MRIVSVQIEIDLPLHLLRASIFTQQAVAGFKPQAATAKLNAVTTARAGILATCDRCRCFW